jgi:uncharacterized protein (TIRG00374 family)
LVVPCETVCGEVTRLYLVHKETKKNYGALAASGVANRIVAYTIVTVGVFSSFILMLVRPGVPALILNFLLVVLLGASTYLAILLYLAFDRRAAERLASLLLKILRALRPKKYHSTELSEKTRESLSIFYNGFKTFRENPRCLVKPFLFQAVAFSLNITVYFLVFYALGIKSQYVNFFIAVYFIVGSLQDISASFSVGTLDIVLTTFFILYGLPPGRSGVATTLLRSVTFWFPVLVGYIVVQIVGAQNILGRRRLAEIEAAQNQQG